MSDDCKCDNCGKRGRRRWGRLAPEDWFFLEQRIDDGNDIAVTLACKKSCALALWKKGPGTFDMADESSARRPDTTAEPAFGRVEEDVLREVGMTLMLTELLGVSCDAVRATAVSRAREYLKT